MHGWTTGMPASSGLIYQGSCVPSCDRWLRTLWHRKMAIHGSQPEAKLCDAVELQRTTTNYFERFCDGGLRGIARTSQPIPDGHTQYMFPNRYLRRLAISGRWL